MTNTNHYPEYDPETMTNDEYNRLCVQAQPGYMAVEPTPAIKAKNRQAWRDFLRDYDEPQIDSHHA